MTYRPPQYRQAGTSCASTNCGPTAAAMAVERDWLGVKAPTPEAIRDWINAEYSVNCSVGTAHYQAIAAVADLYGTTLDYRYNFDFATFSTSITSGRGAMVSIIYSALAGSGFKVSSFNGRHRVFVNERRYYGGQYQFLVYDPLNTQANWWSSSLLKAAMLAAGIEASFTRNTEDWRGTPQKVVCNGRYIYSEPRLDAPAKHAVSQGTLLGLAGSFAKEGPYSVTCPRNYTGTGWLSGDEINGSPSADTWATHDIFYVQSLSVLF